ncbi:MAG: hypothetical protein R6T91_07530 [Bacteroidales bacterium]
MRKNGFAKIALIVVLIVIVISRATSPIKQTIGWDFYGYYLYLPALFKYNDIGLKDKSWINENNAKYNNTPYFYQLYKNQETGKTLIKYPVGQAVAYAPFYFIADVIAHQSGQHPADGFSKPYLLLTVIGGMFYSLLGLLLLYLLLIRLLPDKIAALTLLLIVFGTNYFWLMAFEGQLAHNVQLAWIAAFLLFTMRWFKSFRKQDAFFLGLFYGLAVITRPTAILLILIPLFWNVYRFRDLKNRFRFVFKEKTTHLLLLVLGFLIFASFQMAYWKVTTGSFITYTYQNAGEGFDLLRPHTFDYLFSFRKGWLIYTPLIVFALAGLFTLRKTHKQLFPALLIFAVIYIWVLSSWTCWWYAGSFSQRSILQAYPVFAIGLGSFFVWIATKRFRWIIYGFMILFAGINLFMTWQYQNGILHSSRMSKEYFFEVFGKTQKPPQADRLLLLDRGIPPQKMITTQNLSGPHLLEFSSFENGDIKSADSAKQYSGNYAVKLHTADRFSPAFKAAYKNISENDYVVFKISVMVLPEENIKANELLLVAAFQHKGDDYKYRTNEGNDERIYTASGWQKITFYYLSPPVRNPKNKFVTYLWNRSNSTVWVDDFTVEVFD